MLLVSSTYQVATGMLRLARSVVASRSLVPPRPTAAPELPFVRERAGSAQALLDGDSLASKRARVAAPSLERGYLSAPDCPAIGVHIISESTDRAWSLASLRVGGEPRPRLCRAGDEVAGHRVEFIGYNPRQSSAAVWFSKEARVCQALLAAGERLPAASTASEAPARRGEAGEIAANVERLSDHEFKLSRAAFNKLVEDPLRSQGTVRVVPEAKDGRVVGVRLFGVREGSWLAALGIQNGDRLEALNGFDATKPEAILEAYARLRTASELTARVTRRGAPLEIAVHVR